MSAVLVVNVVIDRDCLFFIRKTRCLGKARAHRWRSCFCDLSHALSCYSACTHTDLWSPSGRATAHLMPTLPALMSQLHLLPAGPLC